MLMSSHIMDSKLVFTNYDATGEDFSVEPAESRRPFRALLDVGLVRTTTGNGIFGALKVEIVTDNLLQVHALTVR
ncbi:60S ribosomal protein L5-like [Canna indica]|uniref:60S ribosomal protein L5-like n=1 Tax=Canna indica TaxID=4628 RepID=A0AAQ3K5G6_9LILI|nr:60S ribosomal protein L5-like [Canna indica]